MPFKDGADVYLELSSSNCGNDSFYRKSKGDEIESSFGVNDDKWLDDMLCGQNADLLLPSSHRKNNKNLQSGMCSSEKVRKLPKDERRDDGETWQGAATSKFFSTAMDSSNDSDTQNNSIIDERDDWVYFSRSSMTERTGENWSIGADPFLRTIDASSQKSIPAAINNRISPAESSGNSSTKRQELKRRRKPSGADYQPRDSELLDPPASPSQLSLDDLIDIKAKIDRTLAEESTSKSPGSNDANNKVSPERALWKLIWERRWKWAQERIRLHPEEVRQKITLPMVSRDSLKQEKVTGNEESEEIHSALPLHLACSLRPLPPMKLFEELINAYPDACREYQKSSGMLPIHLAADLRTYWMLRKEGEEQDGGEFGTQTTFIGEEDEYAFLQLFSRYVSCKENTDSVRKECGQIVIGSSNVANNTIDSTNHRDIIGLLLKSFPESILARERANAMTPLHIAASTTRAENGIVSPVASNVLSMLITHSPTNFATFCKDMNGLTPLDWAWQNVDFFCPRCGMENLSSSNDEMDALLAGKRMNSSCDYKEALQKLDAGMRCKCSESFSVSEKCLHPLLREEIINSLTDSIRPTVRYEDDGDFILMSQSRNQESMDLPKKSAEKSQQVTWDFFDSSPQIDEGGEHQEDFMIYPRDADSKIISPHVLDNIREYTNNIKTRGRKNLSSQRVRIQETLKVEKTAKLHMKIRLSELVHPSNHDRIRNYGINSKILCTGGSDAGGSSSLGKLSRGKKKKLVPSPYFELFAAHRRGMARSYYKSYPLHGSNEGTWEDAFLDLGLTHQQLENGTNGAGHIEVGLRVMHCPPKGSEIKVIGTCQLSLESLQRQQQEILQRKEDSHPFYDVIGDGRVFAISSPEPEKYPILKGYEVTGKLQVLSLAIK